MFLFLHLEYYNAKKDILATDQIYVFAFLPIKIIMQEQVCK